MAVDRLALEEPEAETEIGQECVTDSDRSMTLDMDLDMPLRVGTTRVPHIEWTKGGTV